MTERVPKVRRYVRGMKITQRRIAAQADLDPSTLSKFMVGKMKVSPQAARRLALVLGCHPGDLIGDEDVRPED